MKTRAFILWRYLFTYCHQSMGAPIVDKCNGKTEGGLYWHGYAIHLSPWRFNRFGDRKSGIAFCIGKVSKSSYW